MTNPYQIINERFDKIESLLNQIKESSNTSMSFQPYERLSRKDVKKEYKISFTTIHHLMKTGDLNYSKTGRKTLFLRADLEECFNKKGSRYGR